MSKMLTTKEINRILNLNQDVVDKDINSLELCNRVKDNDSSYLTYVASQEYLKYLELRSIKVVFISKSLLDILSDEVKLQKVFFIVNNPEELFYSLHNYLATETDFYKCEVDSCIHATAKIHRTAVIEEGVQIGAGSEIGANVVIHENTFIGENVRIHANAVIGTEGFQVLTDSAKPYLAKHVGGVVLGNNVSVGSATVIANGLFRTDTTIGDDTLIDSRVFIAHNCTVGKSCVLIAGVTLLGSAKIEDGAWLSVESVVLNKLRVGHNSYVGASSLVAKDVKNGSKVFGVPARLMPNTHRIDGSTLFKN